MYIKKNMNLIKIFMSLSILFFIIWFGIILLYGISGQYTIPLDELITLTQNVPDEQIHEIVNKYISYKYFIVSISYKLFCWCVLLFSICYIFKIDSFSKLKNLPIMNNKFLIFVGITILMMVSFPYYFYINVLDMKVDYYSATFTIPGGLKFWGFIVYLIFFFCSYLSVLFVYFFVYSIKYRNQFLRFCVYICILITLVQSIISLKEPFTYYYFIFTFVELLWLYLHYNALRCINNKKYTMRDFFIKSNDS